MSRAGFVRRVVGHGTDPFEWQWWWVAEVATVAAMHGLEVSHLASRMTSDASVWCSGAGLDLLWLCAAAAANTYVPCRHLR